MRGQCVQLLPLCNRYLILTLTSTITGNDMKRFYKKVFKSNKPSLGSIHRSGPTTSTSTILTSTADLLTSIPTTSSDVTASAEVTAGVSVSVQLRASFFKY